MTQPAFAFVPAPKRIADTSAIAYREIAPSLQQREQQVLDMLATFTEPPTGYEITDRLMRAGLVFDVNSCRPRLVSLCDKGLIVKGEKRACRVTGKTAFTYRVTGEA